VLISANGGATPTAKPCVLSSWSSWTVCSTSCWEGMQSQTRSVISGDCTGQPLSQSQSCFTNCNCTVSAWTGWGNCDKACGTGSQINTRNVVTPAQPGGYCVPLSETQPCNTQACTGTNTDCVSYWGPWSACDGTCGANSQMTRVAIITTPQSGTGAACNPSGVDIQPCGAEVCQDTQCELSDWSAWEYESGCGSTTKVRTREITQSGTTCPYTSSDLSQSEPVNLGSCGSQLLSQGVPTAPTVALVTISAATVISFGLYTLVKRNRKNAIKEAAMI